MQSSYGSSFAQATEIMVAILLGELRHWVDTRVDLHGHDFQSVYCENQKGWKLLIQRMDMLSTSLKNARIMSVSSFTRDSETEFEWQMVYTFVLGTEVNKSDIQVDIVLKASSDESYENERTIWRGWELSRGAGVVCRKHPNPKLNGEIILGVNALVVTR